MAARFLGWGSKKQGATARHTSEAETISLASCLSMEAIPVQQLVQCIMRRAVELKVMEDNMATIISINKGYSPSLRSLKRHHKVSLGFLHEAVNDERDEEGEGKIKLMKAATIEHKGDMFTKELDIPKFQAALTMIKMYQDDRVDKQK